MRELLASSGWAERVADAERFRRMLSGSWRAVVAIVDDNAVGFARAISDGVSNGYLSMVAVKAEYRRQGIGRALIERLMGSDPRITWVLRAGRGSEEFWRKLGFECSGIAMERVRRT